MPLTFALWRIQEMSKKHLAAAFVILLITALSSQTFAQKTFDQKLDQPTSDEVGMSPDNRLVMHAMRTIHSAETTYSQTVGAGNFASLYVLMTNGLIDNNLGFGEKYNYRFTVSFTYATSNSAPSFEVKAVPIYREPRNFSFYVNENCEIRGASKFGREATIKDPVIESCTVFPRDENEKAVIVSLREIHHAQMTYASTYGNGNYGTFNELYNNNLVTTGFALSSVYKGYFSSMTLLMQGPATPARFSVKIAPQVYGRMGTRSFYIDETGVLRGADKQGFFANETDPPIEN